MGDLGWEMRRRSMRRKPMRNRLIKGEYKREGELKWDKKRTIQKMRRRKGRRMKLGQKRRF